MPWREMPRQTNSPLLDSGIGSLAAYRKGTTELGQDQPHDANANPQVDECRAAGLTSYSAVWTSVPGLTCSDTLLLASSKATVIVFRSHVYDTRSKRRQVCVIDSSRRPTV